MLRYAKHIAYTLVLTGFLSVSLSACDNKTLGTKSFSESASFTIPPIPVSGAITIEVPINLAEQTDYQEGDFDNVTSVKVRDIVFDIRPESNDPANDALEDGNLDSFEFISSLILELGADGFEPVEIANLPDNDPQIASNRTTLTMNVLDKNIRDLIEATGGSRLLITVAGTAPPDFVLVNAEIRYRVGVGFR